jgi:alanine racemase
MNRLGINYKDAFKALWDLSKNDRVIIDGIYTHFATADEEDKYFANLQLQRFSELLKKLKDNNINYGLAHCANSGAILDLPNSYFDMVRPGISLYGYYPSQQTSESIRLKPVMSILSKLSTIYSIKKGEYVGYGRLFKAKNNTECGTVSMGYADGLLRGLSNKIEVIIGDKKYSQIGRVSMDRISVNLNKSKLRIGQKVILLGSSKNCKIDAWNWSNILETIPYEITCGISKRVIRKYVGKY